MCSIVIVADDLTGANANGSLLAAKGFSAATCLDGAQWNAEFFSSFDAVSLNSDSRLLSPEEARQRVYDSMRLLIQDAAPPRVASKRIDSTLRGNVGAEIEAALQALDDFCPCLPASRQEAVPGDFPAAHSETRTQNTCQKAVAIVVPAFPASGRHAVGGYLLVDGLPLERSPIAKDPVTPVSSSLFLSIIREQTELPSGHVPLTTVLQGSEAIRLSILAMAEKGIRIIACDAVTDEDVRVLAQAVEYTPFPLLAVDPGPFTAALADVRLPERAREHEDRILLVVGSAAELVQRQVGALKLARRCAIVRVDCRRMVDEATRKAAIEEAVTAVAAQVGDKAHQTEVFGVCTAEKPEDVLSLDALAVVGGISLKDVSERINTGLAEIAERLLANRKLLVGGLYTSGGEVTVAVARRLQASGFLVRDEVLPRAVYGRLISGSHPDLPMVTKGGFVGDEQSIVQCINYLFTKISTQTRPRQREEDV